MIQATFQFELVRESQAERLQRVLAGVPLVTTADRIDVTFSDANAAEAEARARGQTPRGGAWVLRRPTPGSGQDARSNHFFTHSK